MSGNAAAFREMLGAMCHGGKIAMLGIPNEPMAVDWNTVIFNMLTIKGIYGREMYETWYKMTVLIQMRPSTSTPSSPTVSTTPSSSKVSRRCSPAARARSCSPGKKEE